MKKQINYVASGITSIRTHTKVVLENFPGYATDESVNNFLKDNCNKFLTSPGFSIRKGYGIDKTFFKRYQSLFNNFVTCGFFKDIELFVDSAGYSFQVGDIPKKDVENFTDQYYKFLITNNKHITNSFLFDPVPGATGSILDSYDEMEKMNVSSYEKAILLPESVRNKIMYIHHFRTPKIYKLFKKLLYEYKFVDYFQNFATGGIISFSRGAQGTPPCNLYVVPLIDILKNVLDRNIKKFKFHVLGDADYKSILFHRFVEHHVKKLYDVDLEITYDSSTILRTLGLSRYINIPIEENKSIRKFFIRSNDLHLKWMDKGTAQEHFYYLVNNIAKKYGFKILNPKTEPIYADGRITRIMYMYGIFQSFITYTMCDRWCQDIVNELYPIYEGGQTYINEFDNKIESIMKKFNNGKVSRNTRIKTSSLYNSLEMLKDLDLEKNDYIVNRYLTIDECDVLKKYKVKTFSGISF